MDAVARPTFAELLRRLRESRALTQEELAERAGLSAKAVSALERGERLRPYPHTVRSLADALALDETERDELFAAVPPRQRETGSTADAVRTGDQPGPTVKVAPLAIPTVLHGRRDEVERVAGLVSSGVHRLVTLTGPGGVGKTRVALAVLAQLAQDFRGGATFVDLSGVREPELVLPQLAASLGLPDTAGPRSVAATATALGGREVLVVLDNVEQVLAAAPDVAGLVAQCPGLVVLATSRAALRVRAEREVTLGPLSWPDSDDPAAVADAPAVQLFLDRCAAAGAPISLDAASAPVVASICRRLDGLPLALELAAAGSRLLTPSALLARLEGDGPEPGLRDLSARQRTMAATVDWSMELLQPDEQDLFRALSVFDGGFDLTAANAVGGEEGDVLSPLAALVDQSLVGRVASPDDQPRFRMLEPVRQQAAIRLRDTGLESTTRDRHAQAFRTRALSARPELHGSGLASELDRLEAEHANFRSAREHLLDVGRVGDAAELAGSLWLYLGLRGHAREGLSWLGRLDEGASDLARYRAVVGRMGLLFVTGNVEELRREAVRAVPLGRRVGDPSLLAEGAVIAGHAAVFAGDLADADHLLTEAMSAATECGDDWLVAHTLVARGQIALTLGGLGEADQVLGEALDLARALGNAFTLATVLNRSATVSGLRGADARTAALLGESIALSVDARMSWTLGYALPAAAGVALRLGRPGTAARLFGASASMAATQAVEPRFPVSRALADDDLVQTRNLLGDNEFRSAWDAGRAAPREELAELAAELTRLARG